MTLGEGIKARRQQAGLSQEKLAELVGVSRQAVAKWESGRSAPGTENLLRLAEMLDTTVEGLLLAGGPPEPLRGQSERPAPARARGRRNGAAAGCLLLLWLLLFLAVQLGTWDPGSESLLGGLTDTICGPYVWCWLLHNRLFWAALLLSVGAAALGKLRFAATTSALFFFGILAGELLGPFPAGAPYGHGHFGWAVWGGVWLVSLVMGALGEVLAARGVPLRSKQTSLWLAGTAILCAAAVLLVLAARPDWPLAG